jgi:hypothetical protein
MSKIKFGDLTAYLGKDGSGKSRYTRIGTVFKDMDYGTLSIKIDSLPIAGDGWDGWCNIFESQQKSTPTKAVAPEPDDDDIPF